ncbi:MAG: metallophosphoesterase [Carboxylicivirga sp.]|jgi:predicted MPP superfamily phosphohydrolase|nr:metallophosphoesterase [Carboxylicivirga sp.]
MLRLLFITSLFLIVDLYAYQSIKTLNANIWVRIFFLGTNLIVTALTFYIYMVERQAFSNIISMGLSGLFIMLFVSKLVLIIFMFGEDIVRLIQGIIQTSSDESRTFLPSRRKFISQLALGIAAIPFASFLYGIIKGKYNYKVLQYNLFFDDLPEAFDGYKLTHLSDLHCGSFDNKDKIEYAVKLINEQASDAIMITGDIVNLEASELLPWKSTLAKLRAKDGIYSVLGNHDYGNYLKWNSTEEKTRNFEDLMANQKEMGFQVLRNEHHFIERNNKRIAIVGTENWGVGSVQKGDLVEATNGINGDDFSVVLSHDPTHWEEKILKSPRHHHLTLSGHTHGMQFGIEIPGVIKWSPAQWRYKHWAGIYESDKQYINVNRGFGFLAFPGRTGIWPEITVITLKRNKHRHEV